MIHNNYFRVDQKRSLVLHMQDSCTSELATICDHVIGRHVDVWDEFMRKLFIGRIEVTTIMVCKCVGECVEHAENVRDERSYEVIWSVIVGCVVSVTDVWSVVVVCVVYWQICEVALTGVWCHWQICEMSLTGVWGIDRYVKCHWQVCGVIDGYVEWHWWVCGVVDGCGNQGCGLGLDVSVSRRSRNLSKVSISSQCSLKEAWVGKRLNIRLGS